MSACRSASEQSYYPRRNAAFVLTPRLNLELLESGA